MNTSPLIPTKLAERVLLSSGVRMGQVISDIPLLQTISGKCRYPLRDMEVGQHFFVPNKGRTTPQTQNAVTSSVCLVQRTSTRRFHQRRYISGIRVWRTA
jgi:hypothetical protein